MMTRVIPLLHLKGPNLVKGIQMEGLRVLGKPERFASIYYQEGADEIILIDIVASLYGRDNLLDIIQRVSNDVFVPITAGGGIRSPADAMDLLRAGAEKVCINTAAIRRPALLYEIASAFGCQSVVLYVEAIGRDGWWEALTNNARESSGRDVVDWIMQAQSCGIGEILLHSVDRDGTRRGYDLDLVKAVSSVAQVPLIASGGAGSPEHMVEALAVGADAVAAASLFHYGYLDRSEHVEEGNIEFLHSSCYASGWGVINTKEHLKLTGASVRDT